MQAVQSAESLCAGLAVATLLDPAKAMLAACSTTRNDACVAAILAADPTCEASSCSKTEVSSSDGTTYSCWSKACDIVNSCGPSQRVSATITSVVPMITNSYVAAVVANTTKRVRNCPCPATTTTTLTTSLSLPTTTTTTTDPTHTVISGSFTLTGIDLASLNQAPQAVELAIASTIGMGIRQSMVKVSFSGRRLGRQLDAAVSVAYSITVPVSRAADVMSLLTSSGVVTALATNIQTALQGNGITATITVSHMSTPTSSATRTQVVSSALQHSVAALQLFTVLAQMI